MSRDVNMRLAEAIGVDTHHCTGFDLRVRVGEMPALSVHTVVIDSTGVHDAVGVFDLTLRPIGFDLDHACEGALKRLARAVDQSADRARAELRRTARYATGGLVDSARTYRIAEGMHR